MATNYGNGGMNYSADQRRGFTSGQPPIIGQPAAPDNALIPPERALQSMFGPAEPFQVRRGATANSIVLPDVYRGFNPYLTQTITQSVSEVEQRLFSILPITQTSNPDPVITMDTLTFDETVPQGTAPETHSRFISMQTDERSTRTVRKGLAMSIDADLIATERGSNIFTQQLAAMSSGVTMSLYYDALLALVKNSKANEEWLSKTGLALEPSGLTRYQHLEVATFGALQRRNVGLLNLDAMIKPMFESVAGVAPDAYVVPDGALAMTAASGNMDFMFAGAAGADAKLSMFTGGRFQLPNSAEIIEAKRMSTPNTGPTPVCLLSNPVTTGEFTMMTAPEGYRPGEKRHPGDRDVLIYDESADIFARIGFEEAIDALHMDWIGGVPPGGGEEEDHWFFSRPFVGMIDENYLPREEIAKCIAGLGGLDKTPEERQQKYEKVMKELANVPFDIAKLLPKALTAIPDWADVNTTPDPEVRKYLDAIKTVITATPGQLFHKLAKAINTTRGTTTLAEEPATNAQAAEEIANQYPGAYVAFLLLYEKGEEIWNKTFGSVMFKANVTMDTVDDAMFQVMLTYAGGTFDEDKPADQTGHLFTENWRLLKAMQEKAYEETLPAEDMNALFRHIQVGTKFEKTNDLNEGALKYFVQARTHFLHTAPLIGLNDSTGATAELASFLLSRPSKKLLKGLAKETHVPFNICLWKPFVTHEMANLVAARKGCGAVVVNQPNFSLSEDIGRAVILGHFTMRSKAVVGRDRQVMTIRNVLFRKYVGANNSTLFTSPTELTNYAPSYHGPSVIASLMPVANRRKRSRGAGGLRLPPDGAPPRALHCLGYDEMTGRYDMFPGGLAWGIHWGLDKFIRAANQDDDHKVNGLCFRGSSFHYNPQTASFDKYMDATGPLGQAYVGCAAPRSGVGMFNDAHAQSGRGGRAPIHVQ